ncbi:MAG: dethiobiotin synthase [Rhodocyclaceae bacterium]|nr:dethiobiotin synthase [Rhodocyclaceae bacterium]
MHRPQSYFVTGTDTEVGKTFAARALLHAARARGLGAAAMKPVAAGMDANGRNEDVEQLIAASSVKLPRALVNPYCFTEAIAPHVAAAHEQRTIEPGPILDAYRQVAGRAEFVVVEGVGGFRVPLAEGFDTADLATRLGLPVILVVGLRLGCLNHALLTAEAIAARGLGLAGWIANRIDPAMPGWLENIAALQRELGAPLLGTLPWQVDGDAIVASFALSLPESPAEPANQTAGNPSRQGIDRFAT